MAEDIRLVNSLVCLSTYLNSILHFAPAILLT